MGKGGGGGGGQPTQQNVNQTNLPEYARPYFENIMERAQAESYRPYQGYGGERIAGFTPGQTTAQQEALSMQTPGQFGQATGMISGAGQQAVNYGQMGAGAGQQAMNYGQLGSGYGGQAAGYGQLGSQYGVQQGDIYGQMGAGAGQQALGYGAAGAGIGQQALGYGRVGAGMGRQALGYGAAGAGLGGQASLAGQQYQAMATDPTAMQAYMSPYMQNVVDVQKQEAIRDAQKAQLGQNLAAARQGTYGGARQLLAQTERERALGQNLASIQATGMQDAFKQAQQAQQFGSTLGLQGLQAGMQGQQIGLAGVDTGLRGAQLGLSGLETGLRGAQTGIQGTQAGMQGAQIGLQGAETGLRGIQTGIQGAQAGMQGAQTGIQGAQAGMQGAQVGLQGAEQLTQAGQALGQLGQAEQQANLQRIQAQAAAGAEQRAQRQSLMDLAYADFLRQRDYPMEQLGYFSNLMRGIPVGLGSTTTTYAPPPSLASQAAGLGLAGLGLYNLGKNINIGG